MKNYPEGCTLVAVDTGEGYMLAVEDETRQVVAELAWPASWARVVSADFLRLAGFRVIPA